MLRPCSVGRDMPVRQLPANPWTPISLVVAIGLARYHESMCRKLRLTYIGGPTALLEFAGLRCLTDPTLDPAGTEYPTAAYTLRKTQSPAIAPAQLGQIDAVLLSHDHHFDNLDHSGRSVLQAARHTYTTVAGAERLGGRARGLALWESAICSAPGAPAVKLTRCRHDTGRLAATAARCLVSSCRKNRGLPSTCRATRSGLKISNKSANGSRSRWPC